MTFFDSPILFFFYMSSILFSLVFLISIIRKKINFFRYIFSFLSAFSIVFIYYPYLEYLIFSKNFSFYSSFEQNYYFIPLTFAIIQLLIEFYYFYKKEKVKWERYKRMQKYKQSKSK